MAKVSNMQALLWLGASCLKANETEEKVRGARLVYAARLLGWDNDDLARGADAVLKAHVEGGLFPIKVALPGGSGEVDARDVVRNGDEAEMQRVGAALREMALRH